MIDIAHGIDYVIIHSAGLHELLILGCVHWHFPTNKRQIINSFLYGSFPL